MTPWATSAAADKLSYLRQQMTWDARMEGVHVSKGVSSFTFESAAGVCGRIVKSGSRTVPNYEINDYLGSVRVVTGPTGSVLARHDYYATGARMNTGNTGTGRGRFVGKELQDVGTLGWLDFGARMYDPSIARWTVQDPLAEKYLSWSPYAYCVADPVNYFDPDGNRTFVKDNQDGTYTVCGGILADTDRGIYVIDDNNRYVCDTYGNAISIGVSMTPISFYDVGRKQWTSSVIDMNDTSGSTFI